MTADMAPAKRWPLTSWLGVLGMALAGVVAALVGAFISAIPFAYRGTGTADVLGFFAVFTLLAIGPAVAMRWTRSRYGYGCAAGMVVCWATLTAWLLPHMLEGPGMSSEELARATQRIEASGTRVYYVGAEAQGNDLDEVYRDGEFGASGVSVGYGLSCGGGDLGCWSDIYVRTLSMSPQYIDVYGCERMPAVMGVPAVKRATDDSMIVFTGTSMISLEDNESASALESELDLARALRPLGESKPVTELPAPTPRILRYIDRTCG